MKLTNLNDLLVEQLRDIYFAEKHITKALPKLAKASSSVELKQAFTDHLEETRQHVSRLEQVFELLNQPVKAKRCPAIIGLIEEGGEMVDEKAEPDVRDAGLIAAAQRVEHYEIAAYGCARAFARRLGLDEIADILTQTIDEEGACDQKLTELAENRVNAAAVAPLNHDGSAQTPAASNGRKPSGRSGAKKSSTRGRARTSS